MDESNRDEQTQLQKRENKDVRRQLWSRFRPKFWLSLIWKKISIRSRLNDLKDFLHANTVPVSISVALGLCHLIPKLAPCSSKVVPYSNLIEGVQNGTVTSVQFEENSRRIFFSKSIPDEDEDKFSAECRRLQATFAKVAMFTKRLGKFIRNPASIPELQHSTEKQASTSTTKWEYSTRNIDQTNYDIHSLIRQNGITYSSVPQSVFMSVRSALIDNLSQFIRSYFLHHIYYEVKSTARQHSKQTVRFNDVEGLDVAKAELMEIISCLRGDINYKRLRAKLPRGVLLVGPPGTGKTLLARAMAGEAGVPFFYISASEFVELYVGTGAARIRNLFKVARKRAPSIIFIDELDAVGGKRGRGLNSEDDRTLNQLLVEMDGFELDKKVVVIASTNRPETLDPALCRPGRFSRKVFVGQPDEEGRRKILAVHFRGVPLEEDTSYICNAVASLTQGLVGADLANIVNEATLLAARRGGAIVSMEDIMEAIRRTKFEIK